ncbi:enoyl-CoA hydratase/isomerase family protein [Pseudoflavonifractor sp. 524-17]|uniref:enoyl-CoA hydratase-related protein n=1 Tax=Pseudoflavonifractor sp. 524-17 TaxID=2304577 RepID=UPI00137A5A63|nr:enoyl-CoA hydratase-related protein [Pseudoflavonifractor sp. 524-17]NCE65075.1 enoyl-CoA hydratase/isomerase family protein [Pseudoflavonifractor sp. 524-17]
MGFVKLERQDHIGIVTIDRPEALNALNSQVLTDLDGILDQVEADDTLYAVILTGAGRSFVAGADIAEMKDFSSSDGKRFGVRGGSIFLKLEHLSKPVIAAVNGFALGGGCELAMACDIRLASEKAKFGQPEVGLGITPGFGGTQRLPRIVGVSKAMELILTAKVIKAEEAKEIGLVSAVYPPEELMDRAMELAQAICANAQIAVRESKRCIRMGMQADIHTASAFEAEAFGVTCGTADKDEGMGAFLEKRSEKHFVNR